MIAIITVCLLAVATVFDIKYKRIPNYITLPAIPAGIIITLILNPSATPTHLVCIAALFAVSFLGIIGNGDVKLLMAVAAFNSWVLTAGTLVIGCICMVVTRLVYKPKKTAQTITDTVNKALSMQWETIGATGEKLPFAPFLLIGYLLSFVACCIVG